ncbi:MAG: RRXRR domain-containing protein [Coleofasciculus sp.]
MAPTKPSRVPRWVKEGKAVGKWSDLGVYYVQLTTPPSAEEVQPITVGIDPGKSYSGVGIQSAKCTLVQLHLILPFGRVKKRMETRAMLRRGRRGRRINRDVPFNTERSRGVEVPDKSGVRKRKGGTITPFGVRIGDWVRVEKAGKVYIGYVSGFTDTERSKKVSVCDYTWKRIGQFAPSKVELIRRANGLCIA